MRSAPNPRAIDQLFQELNPVDPFVRLGCQGNGQQEFNDRPDRSRLGGDE
jgi:hypothetical protein